ncbi:hypothetical protein HUJ04_006189 [Dendroctonus ponderosae]|uniref:Kynurenine 3-monooxygenase n=1 Tax=Dendroctonus ponderosae TaxID=77166 RepID=A0AAR5Q8C4_DENPD|nr:hypothetical protein HUJ04_006189 [Dendroctonus ponderosae]
MHGKNADKASVIVIGGGLVGSLCACLMAQRGYRVTLYEKREDIRRTRANQGRSINLALSHRGRKALRLIGIEANILKNAIPMSARFLHNEFGSSTIMPYDPTSKQCIYSVGRNALNCALLTEAESRFNVDVKFNQKLVGVDFGKGAVTVQCTVTNTTLTVSADFIMGADGAFSTLRLFLQKCPLFDFSQYFIDHGYLELSVPAERGDGLVNNHLHIWPRGEFMMIALPNQDHSWTVTLFMPFKQFAAINSREKLLRFFRSRFPDALPLIGARELEEVYFGNAPASLVSIKCGRFHIGDKFLIIGDAAHAMVPFFGQGMNAGFEDCTLLDELLNHTKGNLAETARLFSEMRLADAHAICDLAMYNYKEMRDLVTKRSFKLRKHLDQYLSKLMPHIWIPLYISVSFTHMKYRECLKNKQWQDKVLFVLLLSTAGLMMLMCLAFAITFNH